ncbi:MAG: hypothetical protein V7609_2339 [Verrucomicrobiota bacterium]
MRAVRRCQRWLAEFLFPLESDLWLACLRVGLGLQVIFYALSLRGDWRDMFGPNANGLVGREIAEAILASDSVFAPRITWLTTMGSQAGLSEEAVLSLIWWLLLVAGGFLLIGLFSQGAAIAAWFIHLCAVGSGELLLYGADSFTSIGLFYLMLAPLPDGYTLDARWRRVRRDDPRLLGLFRRVLQLHLCLVYFFGGIAKSLGSGWWNGESVWRALTRPPFNVISPDILVSWRYLFPVAGILICILETGYIFFIWPKRTRLLWLICMLGAHVGIAITMGLYLFSFVMIVLNIAAFGAGLIRLPFRTKRLAVPAAI